MRGKGCERLAAQCTSPPEHLSLRPTPAGARLLSGACTAATFLRMRHWDALSPQWLAPSMTHHSPTGCLHVSPPRPHPRWLEFALLNCYGSYPTPGVNFFTNPEPGPGNVALCVTQTCKK